MEWRNHRLGHDVAWLVCATMRSLFATAAEAFPGSASKTLSAMCLDQCIVTRVVPGKGISSTGGGEFYYRLST